jgi:hypothetical protein
VESHERAQRSREALFGPIVAPQITFNEPSSYLSDSFSRQLGEDEASGRVAQVRMHARYHEVAVLADFLLALGAVRSHY